MTLTLIRPRIRTALVVGLAGAGGVCAGGALAQGEPPDEALVQVAADAERAELYYEELWGGALEKAQAGELQADVDQQEAAQTLSEALDPPADVDEAEALEAEMIALTAELREAGDLPALDDESRFDSVGGPIGSEVGSGE